MASLKTGGARPKSLQIAPKNTKNAASNKLTINKPTNSISDALRKVVPSRGNPSSNRSEEEWDDAEDFVEIVESKPSLQQPPIGSVSAHPFHEDDIDDKFNLRITRKSAKQSNFLGGSKLFQAKSLTSNANKVRPAQRPKDEKHYAFSFPDTASPPVRRQSSFIQFDSDDDDNVDDIDADSCRGARSNIGRSKTESSAHLLSLSNNPKQHNAAKGGAGYWSETDVEENYADAQDPDPDQDETINGYYGNGTRKLASGAASASGAPKSSSSLSSSSVSDATERRGREADFSNTRKNLITASVDANNDTIPARNPTITPASVTKSSSRPFGNDFGHSISKGTSSVNLVATNNNNSSSSKPQSNSNSSSATNSVGSTARKRLVKRSELTDRPLMSFSKGWASDSDDDFDLSHSPQPKSTTTTPKAPPAVHASSSTNSSSGGKNYTNSKVRKPMPVNINSAKEASTGKIASHIQSESQRQLQRQSKESTSSYGTNAHHSDEGEGKPNTGSTYGHVNDDDDDDREGEFGFGTKTSSSSFRKGTGEEEQPWTCAKCTYDNAPSHLVCDVCGEIRRTGSGATVGADASTAAAATADADTGYIDGGNGHRKLAPNGAVAISGAKSRIQKRDRGVFEEDGDDRDDELFADKRPPSRKTTEVSDSNKGRKKERQEEEEGKGKGPFNTDTAISSTRQAGDATVAPTSSSAQWTCSYCTLVNEECDDNCAACDKKRIRTRASRGQTQDPALAPPVQLEKNIKGNRSGSRQQAKEKKAPLLQPQRRYKDDDDNDDDEWDDQNHNSNNGDNDDDDDDDERRGGAVKVRKQQQHQQQKKDADVKPKHNRYAAAADDLKDFIVDDEDEGDGEDGSQGDDDSEGRSGSEDDGEDGSEGDEEVDDDSSCGTYDDFGENEDADADVKVIDDDTYRNILSQCAHSSNGYGNGNGNGYGNGTGSRGKTGPPPAASARRRDFTVNLDSDEDFDNGARDDARDGARDAFFGRGEAKENSKPLKGPTNNNINSSSSGNRSYPSFLDDESDDRFEPGGDGDDDYFGLASGSTAGFNKRKLSSLGAGAGADKAAAAATGKGIKAARMRKDCVDLTVGGAVEDIEDYVDDSTQGSDVFHVFGELKPSYADIAPNFWSVRDLRRSGRCAIDFDSFKLDSNKMNYATWKLKQLSKQSKNGGDIDVHDDDSWTKSGNLRKPAKTAAGKRRSGSGKKRGGSSAAAAGAKRKFMNRKFGKFKGKKK